MSIRNKFVVSNMLMVIVPVAIITAVILLTTLSITYFSTSKMSFDPSFGSYLLYKTQFNVSSLEDKIKTPKKSDTDRLGAMDKKRIAPLRAGITKSGSRMEDRISDAIIAEDEISDKASPTLSDIRRKIRTASSKAREVLDKIVHGSSYSK